jgi:cell division protein FtsZ
MTSGGMAVISVGSASGAHRVEEVVQNTLKNKLLDVDYSDATGVLLHITGGKSLTLGEANQIGTKLTERSAPNANVIWGARLDPEYGDIKILKSAEIDILKDGSLDLDRKTLERMDYRLASVHTNLKMTREEMTERVVGVGGGGNNTVHRISSMDIKGASLFAFNTDGKQLNTMKTQTDYASKGKKITPREAAYIIAVSRVAAAMKTRGMVLIRIS